MTELSGVISVVFILYVILMLGIGWVTSRKATSPSQFFLADRSLKAWVTAVSSTASSESAWAVLGTVGLVYKEGLAAIWFLPGCLLGYVLNWLFLAERLRKHSHETNAITIPDYLESHFNDKTNVLRLISVVIIFACMMAYVGAQFAAIGKTFDAIFGVPHHVSIPIGAAIIIMYTMLGGFLAVAWTDFVQGLIMVFGLVMLSIVALVSLGGFGGMVEHLSQSHPQTLDWMGGRTVGAFFGFMVGLLGIGLGYPGQPHVLNRYMAAKDAQVIRHGLWIAMGWGLLVYGSSILLGLCGHALFPGLSDPEHLFPKAAEALLPTVVSAVVLTGVLAAIMSTVSAQIIVAASAVAHDVYTKMISRDMTHKQIILISRMTILILGLGAMIIALFEVPVIFWFVLLAWSGLGASFGPVILFTLYSKKVTRAGAIAGMITGFTVTLIWKVAGWSDSLIYELVPAFLLASLAVWGVSRCTTVQTRESTENLLKNELSEPAYLLKRFKHVLSNDSSHATYKVYRELYQLGELVIPEIEAQLLGYPWDNIKYDMQMKILSGFLSLANDINEERAREIGEKIHRKGCSKGVDASIKSILNFSLDEFNIYPINGVDVYQSKSLNNEGRIKNKMTKWLSMVPDEDLNEIERLYLIPTHEKYSGTYMPILYNIMVVWNVSSYYNPLSYFRLLWIEHTLYHEIGHHVCRHTFGQDPEQEKEANRYAAGLFKKTHPILTMILKTLKSVFEKKKTIRRTTNLSGS